MKNKQLLETIVWVLLVIGGLNWGLIGFFEWNLVGIVFGYTSVITRVIYAVVGIAALYKILSFSQKKKR